MSNYEIPEKSRWSLQLLTTDYLVEGFVDGDKDKNSLNFQPLEREWKYYFLTKASYHSTGILSIPAKSDMEWIAFYDHELIAVISA